MKNYIFGLILLCFGTQVMSAPNEVEIESAWVAAEKAQVVGPTKVTIANQAEINIPKGFSFIPKQEAQRAMTAMGNGIDEDLQGLIVPTDESQVGMYTIDYSAEGYIKDDDAKDLNAKDILADYKEGTEQGNKERVAKGFPAMELSGWAQEPVYDEKLHRLTWALKANDKGIAPSDEDTVNHQTRLLGREGVISITWLASLKDLNTANKSQIDAITAGVQYVDGKKYENFSASTGDKVAEYGLAALITGAAAKKLGLFAIIAAFLAKFAKFGIIALIAAFPIFKRLFKKKDQPVSESSTRTESKNSAESEPSTPPASATTEAQAQQELKDTTKL